MNKYAAFYGGKKISVSAKSLYEGKLKAIEEFKVPKSKVGLLAIVLYEKAGIPVPVSPWGI